MDGKLTRRKRYIEELFADVSEHNKIKNPLVSSSIAEDEIRNVIANAKTENLLGPIIYQPNY